MTDPELQEHIYALEDRLLNPDRESDRSALVPLLASDFKEFCSSGRVFNRDQTIHALLHNPALAATINFFYVTRLAPLLAHATYQSVTTHSTTYRSSLWIFRDQSWQLFFHQGTIAHRPTLTQKSSQ
jgi:hypothetical protein